MFSSDFIGRLHPLIVHLPIGILLFAFALIVFQRFRKVEIDPIIGIALLWGSLTAAAACVAGWLLAQSGEYDADLVFYINGRELQQQCLVFQRIFLNV